MLRSADRAGVAQGPLVEPVAARRVGSFTEQARSIAAPRLAITDRAGRWATLQVGRRGRSVAEVASDLRRGWHAVMDAVAADGEALIDDPDRSRSSKPSRNVAGGPERDDGASWP